MCLRARPRPLRLRPQGKSSESSKGQTLCVFSQLGLPLPRYATFDLLGLTNEEPNETTLLALLNAMFATALATGTPF